jgi:hypothetical protein
LVTPNGGEAWSMGSEYVIRWETNIADSVRLDLLYGQQNILSIDTTFRDPSAFRWLVPTNLTVDSSYKIIITSINDPLIKDTSDASFSIVPPSDVEIVNSDVPEDYSISQNYPNPFNPSTEIEFNLPESGLTTLKVFDILGKEITTLVNEQMQAGNYKLTFDASNLPSGIYFYSLHANDFVSTKKMVLLK